MLNQDFGIINYILNNIFSLSIPWLEESLFAKVSLILVNLWLGYPYIMIISMGTLQSISPNLYEVAALDGASGPTITRYITLPLVLKAVAPLLIGAFAFNFNNFSVIYLLTGGGPPMVGAQTPIGETDILLSYTYKLAFESSLGNDYGLASTVSIVVFFIVAALSVINLRLFAVKKNWQ